MSYEHVLVEKKDHITVVTMNRPDVMNAVHPPANLELDQIFNDFQEDPSQWVAIITGAGEKAFSAGNDLRWQSENSYAAVKNIRRKIKGGFGGIVNRFDLHKPLIAAVNGYALGGGFEIALACDIIIASDNAAFGLPETRVGLMAGAGGVHRLPRQMPYHAAMAVILAGKRLSPDEALRYGIVSEVVPQADLMDAALRWAGEVLKGSPLAVQASKEATTRAYEMPLDRAIDIQYPKLTRLYESEDLIEGPKAFVEKRPPQWTGE